MASSAHSGILQLSQSPTSQSSKGKLLRRDEGLDLMTFSVYVLFMHSPCHIIQLALQKKIVMEFFFYVVKYRFSIIPKCLFRWNNPCNAAHLHFFSWYFFLMLGGCYCRLPAKMFIWLVVESISIWYVLYFTWYDSTKYGHSLKVVFSIILFSHKFHFLRSFSQPFLDIQPWNFT